MLPDHSVLNNRDWLHQKYAVEQMSDRAIADMLDCKPHHVRAARRRFGIASRPRGHNLRKANGNGHNYMLQPGASSPFRDCRHTARARQAISQAASRPRAYLRGERNGMYGRTGEANPNFKHGLSPERQRIYSSAEWQEFKRQICERDGHRCRRCGARTTEKRGMHLHHIKSWEQYPELRMESSNVVLMCRACHEWVTSKKNVNREWLD